jgi:hypothetical protein
VVNLLLLALVIVLAGLKVLSPLSQAFNEQMHHETLPVGAVEWIREHRPDGEMFNPYNWGGYLVWALWPEYRVFVDGRTDLYGDEILRQYLDVWLLRPGFEDILASYDVRLVLTYSNDVRSAHLACVDGWTNVFRDEIADVWVLHATEAIEEVQ